MDADGALAADALAGVFLRCVDAASRGELKPASPKGHGFQFSVSATINRIMIFQCDNLSDFRYVLCGT